MNYDILGLIIQNVSKESYNTYIKDHILEPLDMEHTAFKKTNSKNKHEAVGYEQSGGAIKKVHLHLILRYTFSLLMSNTRFRALG